jgi:ATP-dependent DNA helicase RecQ
MSIAMSFDFNKLQTALADWPESLPDAVVSADVIIERIRQILAMSKEPGGLSKADLQPLVRHLLMRESARSGHPKDLRVPQAAPWPTAAQWQQHGVSALPVGTNAYLLSAHGWEPSWLESPDSRGVFADAYAGKSVRQNGWCAADPFIEAATGFKSYSSPGQREAIRGSFLIPPGHTLIVNLPTGSGKSLVGYAPALVHKKEGHLTLFVVPTVALAMDQARQISPYLFGDGSSQKRWPLALYSGLSESERAEIRERMSSGTQRILFTSPEALTGSLLRTVFEVVRQGMLRYLVIDEAHLITQWGDEFRPAFQSLAGLRNGLLRQAGENPFRTVLLSATFTAETVETLANLFGPSEHVQMVAAVHLRPEPQYWWSHAVAGHEKKTRVLEALRFAPRPFILYVTTREDARDWYNILREAGYKRLQRFDGQTPDNQRKVVIDDWAANRLDGVVATSAFGVGIDKQDVRTIIHATIPETLDRFYQEVGRGGRDGYPAVSLLIYDDTDWSTSQNLATPTIISNELGFERWQALYASRVHDSGGVFSVNLNAVRAGLSGSNDENVRWNMRTLQLMSRAGFLTLELNPSDENDFDDDDSPASVLTAFARVGVRLLREDHLLASAWNDEISNSRRRTLDAGEHNLRLMRRMLIDRREVSETLAELYRNRTNPWPIEVTRVCGGCPADRLCASHDLLYHVPTAVPVYQVVPFDLAPWYARFPHLDPRSVSVFYDSNAQPNQVLRLLNWLVRECGVQEVSIAKDSLLLSARDEWELFRRSASGIVIHRGLETLDDEPYTALGRVTVFDSHVTNEQIHSARLLLRPLHVVLYPQNAPDPDHPARRLADTAMYGIRIEQFDAVINQ